MSPDQLERLCTTFRLGAPVSIEEDEEGVLNRNFDLTTDTGRYFIKSVRDRRKDSIPVIAAAESFMAEGGIPAVRMLRTADGELYVRDDDEVFTVYPYIDHARPGVLPLEALGTMLAFIHERGDEVLPSALLETQMREKTRARVEEKLNEYRTKAETGSLPADALFRAYITRKLELLPLLPTVTEASLTLVHGDYHARNILFDEVGSILGICDWEKAERAPRAYELARSMQYICFESREAPYRYDRAVATASAKRFLAAYRERYPLTDQDIRNGFALRLRKLVMSFWIEETFYDRADERANKFIENETRLIEEFADGRIVEEFIEG